MCIIETAEGNLSLIHIFCHRKGIEVQLVSARNEADEIAATALIQWEKSGGEEYGYLCYGFNLDYTNTETLQFFATALAELAKRRGAAYLRMELNIPRIEHEKDGRIKPGGFNNEFVTAQMEACGYHHLGYTYGYSGNRMSRFTYCLNLDQPLETIRKQIKHYAAYQKKNIQRAVSVKLSDARDLSILVEAERELAHKLHFLPKKEKDFRQLMECFPDQARLYVVSANVDQALSHLKILREQLICQQEKLINAQRLAENQKQIAALDQEIAELMRDYQGLGEIKLGAKLIIQQGEHVYNVNMYTCLLYTSKPSGSRLPGSGTGRPIDIKNCRWTAPRSSAWKSWRAGLPDELTAFHPADS